MGDSDATRKLIKELSKGRAWAEQLHSHLNSASSSSNETRESLVRKILKTYEKSLSLLKEPNESPRAFHNAAIETTSLGEGSQESDHDTRDTSRRKMMPKWKQQVKVRPGKELESPHNDGFSWRKYGQKVILGARYPRGYYRCTNRHSQGCLATKHVQRLDNDPTIFEITYKGSHTCSQGPNACLVDNLAPQLPNPDPEQDLDQHNTAPLESNLNNSLADTLAQSFSSFQFHSGSAFDLQDQALTAPGLIDGSMFMATHHPPDFSIHTNMMRDYTASSSFQSAPNRFQEMNFPHPETSYTVAPSSSGFNYLFGYDNQNHSFDSPGYFP